VTETTLLDEAVLHLRWARSAGRWLFEDDAGRPVEVADGGAGDSAAEAVAGGEVGGGLEPEDREAALERVAAAARACRRCSLCETRTTVVVGEGSVRPRLLFVGEAPGADEDRTGRPFVGRAGQLLTKMIEAIGLDRADVHIANVLKCRPPDNRPPRPDEVAACRPFLEEQVRLLDPALVVSLGNHATRALLGTDRGIGSLRGRIQTLPDGRRVLPTFHPAYLLRTPEAKREAWQDLRLAAATVGLTIPARRAGAPAPSPS
jgi:DNA polymerase